MTKYEFKALIKEVILESKSVFTSELTIYGSSSKMWFNFEFDDDGNIINIIPDKQNYKTFNELPESDQKKLKNQAKKDFLLNYIEKNKFDKIEYSKDDLLTWVKHRSNISELDFDKLKIDDMILYRPKQQTMGEIPFIIKQIKGDNLKGIQHLGYKLYPHTINKFDDVIILGVARK